MRKAYIELVESLIQNGFTRTEAEDYIKNYTLQLMKEKGQTHFNHNT